MNKNNNYFFGLVVVLLVILGVAVFIKEGVGGLGGGGIGTGSVAQAPIVPVPDDISVVSSTVGSGGSTNGGGQIVVNRSAGYYFALPSIWYLEKNAGAGVTVYPDYSPSSTAEATEAAACKIEVSAFAAPNGTDLNTWLANYFNADPTATVAQTSLSEVTIAGVSGIEWRGTMNGVTTTLVYAQTGGKIIEVAPSTLSEASDADNDDCDPALATFLSNLNFGTYKP